MSKNFLFVKKNYKDPFKKLQWKPKRYNETVDCCINNSSIFPTFFIKQRKSLSIFSSVLFFSQASLNFDLRKICKTN